MNRPEPSSLLTDNLDQANAGKRLLAMHEMAGIYSWELNLENRAVEFSCSLASSIAAQNHQPHVDDIWNSIDPTDRDRAEQAWELCEEKGKSEFTHRLIVKGGRTRTVRHYLKMFGQDSGAQPKMMVGLMLDVTERDQLNFRLAEASSELASILAAIDDGVYTINDRGRITEANPSAAYALGYALDEFVGRSAHDTIHHSHPEGNCYHIKECPLHGSDFEKQLCMEETLWRKDGTSFVAACTRTPIFDSSGIVSGAVITFRELTGDDKVSSS